MYYSIGRHLSLAKVGSRIVALDSSTDRYAAFPVPRSDALSASLTSLSHPEARRDIAKALRLSGLTLDKAETPFIESVRVPAPAARLASSNGCAGSRRRRLAARIDVVRAAARLRIAGFERAILRFCDRGLVPPRRDAAHPPAAAIAATMADFEQARTSVPIARRCLVDSLALRETLWREGIWADLVIAVQLDPFGAHCWLQTGDLILNEDVEVARRMTPIRMV